MKSSTRVAVTSRSFSRQPVLRGELLDRYKDVRFNDEGVSLEGSGLIDFARGATMLITALERIDEEFLSALPEIEVISKYGVGTDMVDFAALIRHNIRFGWTGGVNKRSVSELVVSNAISLLRHVKAAGVDLGSGSWRNRMGRCISGRTVGIIGCGNIGKDLAVLLRGFDCEVLANDIRDFPEFYSKYGVQPIDLDNLLGRADIVTLHVPLKSDTRNLLSSSKLEKMRPDALLINAARGGLVDEVALKEMLKTDRLAGAAFDVFVEEPATDLELLQLPNFIATPHVGGSTEEAILAMGRAAIDGLEYNALPVEGDFTDL